MSDRAAWVLLHAMRASVGAACVRRWCVLRAMRASVGAACVRPWCVLHPGVTVSAFERTLAVSSLYVHFLALASHGLMQCPAQHKILKTLKMIRY
jgi:hypothetical protein